MKSLLFVSEYQRPIILILLGVIVIITIGGVHQFIVYCHVISLNIFEFLGCIDLGSTDVRRGDTPAEKITTLALDPSLFERK